MGSSVTYSRSLTVTVTASCANRCRYCGFWSPRIEVLSLESAAPLFREGKRRGCREALILSGEHPWRVAGFPLDEDGFVQRVWDLCSLALQSGLLPHTNVGTLSFEALGRLRSANVSMGLMLETVNDALAAHTRRDGRGKRVADRLRHIRDAGVWRIPFTTGILVGIGESRQDRHDALDAIAEANREYGHIQEVIIQNFRPKAGTPMARWPEPSLEELVDAVAYARSVMPQVVIQVPPNLNHDRCLPLLEAGANDVGGLSVNGDQVNPESPNPEFSQLEREIKSGGYHLIERLPVHPRVDADLQPAADTLRQQLVGDTVTYVVNSNVNFTNVCSGTCGFCAFRRGRSHRDAFTLTVPEVVEKVRRAVATGATEVCMQGGLNADLDPSYYFGVLEAIKGEFPDLHIHAFSPMEVYTLARRTGSSVEEVLKRLRGSGLDSMPGTAAEILVDEVRDVVCPKKLMTAEWIDVITKAHRLGIRTTATIMYGHIESWEHRIRHLEVLRNIQLDTGGFTELVLLPFLPGTTALARRYKLKGPALEETLKLTAYARLYLGADLLNIQNSWVKLGVEGAQETLRWGANDFGGTLMEESISRSAGSKHGQYLSAGEIEAAIVGAGRVPAQRDTLYRLLEPQPEMAVN